MKTIYKKLLFLMLLLPFLAFAQNSVNGTVVDAKSKQPLPSVNVVVQGVKKGVSTDFNGNFKIPNIKSGDKIVFSFIGFQTAIVTYTDQKTIAVSLKEDDSELKEVVVQVGYGSVKKKDATGSVALLTSKDFNKGAITSVDQLLTGKVAGVRITTDGGQPDSNPNIIIRGGTSIGKNSQNKPLIVIDGVPISNDNPAGVSNPLSMLNPNDIESFSILKDASATAIYGIRAANGVIIVTTKKGTMGKTQFNFSTNVSVGSVGKIVDVMGSADYVKYIKEYFPARVNDLGIQDPAFPLDPTKRIIYDTNWQDQIYRGTITTDNNFSVRTNLFKKIPFRASVGYTNAEGLVRTNDYKRLNLGFKMTPMLLDNHLKIDINAKGSRADKNAIDEGGAISGAITMDPTKPVYGNTPNNRFGGFYQNTNLNGGKYLVDGQSNPLALLMQRTRPEVSDRFLGNMEFDYKLHFFPQVRAILNLGIDASGSTIKENFSNNSVATYRFNSVNTSLNSTNNYVFNPGLNYLENQTNTNKTMDSYFVYTKENLGKILTKFDVTAGYTYQDFRIDGNKEIYRYNKDTGIREVEPNVGNPNNRYFNQLNLQSFFGRANFDILNRYLFTATYRADASSLFSKENRWGYFPSAGFAWKIKEESFLKNVNFLQDFKVRIGWGKTGNANITELVGYYPSQPTVTINSGASQYLPGFNNYSPNVFDSNLTWEKTTTLNAGVDFEIFKKGIISGSFDIYERQTNDLLAKYNIKPGQGLSNQFVGNVGTVDSKGFELSLNAKIIQGDNLNLSFNTNLGYSYAKVTDLKGTSKIEAEDGSLPVGTGIILLYHAVGYQPSSAWVFQQIYTANGQPIPGAFVDLNGDGQITNEDRYFKATRPNWTFGFGTNFNYKNFDFSASFRGQYGGQTYDTRTLTAGYTDRGTDGNAVAFNNVLNFYNGSANPLFKTFNSNAMFSDHMLQDASFIRCDNMSIGYKLPVFVKGASLRLSAAVSNAFILTKYKGLDPEKYNGIDTNFYPRPRVYTIGLNLDF
jgi:TonB-dependent starch-binding outer membrane protein SusC